ncbi:GAF domain-containing protein, partial [Mycobacterium stomatepiae]|nr:GAF domain-containing protein [Mycobacterium stomatepiae]
LRVLASSSEQTRLLELFQIQANVGPCLQAYRSGTAVLVGDLSAERDLWPGFAERALDYGFHAVCALPMRLRDECIGALNLFSAEAKVLSGANVAVGQALADVATIGILHQRVLTRSELVKQQLQTALNTRVIIEQAKGVLAERGA